MNAATQKAFFDELNSIYSLEKDAGLREALKAGTHQVKVLAEQGKKLVSKVEDLDTRTAIKLDDVLRKATGGKVDAAKVRKAIGIVHPNLPDT